MNLGAKYGIIGVIIAIAIGIVAIASMGTRDVVKEPVMDTDTDIVDNLIGDTIYDTMTGDEE